LRADTGDWLAAITDYTDAIRLAPDQALIYQNRAKAYASLGEFEKAKEDEAKAKTLKAD
jgi:tetratricopeptide (TPR) repeat protein